MKSIPFIFLLALCVAVVKPPLGAFEVSQRSVFEPSPDLPTTELILESWRTISRSTLGDGRDELVAAPSLRNSNVGQFTSATFVLTSAPPEIEIVDGSIQAGTNGSSLPVLLANATLVLQDTITLRAPTGTFDPEAGFLTGFSAPNFVWNATARELPVVADGVKVIERLMPSGGPLDGNAYEFEIPDTAVVFFSAEQYSDDINEAIVRANQYIDQLLFGPGGEPILALIFVSDPDERAALEPARQAEFPPEELLPSKAGLSSWETHDEFPGGTRVTHFYSKVFLYLDDPSPLYVNPEAYATSGTFLGAFGTVAPPNAPSWVSKGVSVLNC